MLTSLDIDNIINNRKKGLIQKIYYVASNAELKEIEYPRSMRESAHEFTIVEYDILRIDNALNEYERSKEKIGEYDTAVFKTPIVKDPEVQFIEYEYKYNNTQDIHCSSRVYDIKITTTQTNGNTIIKTIPSVCTQLKYTNNPTFCGKAIEVADSEFNSLYGWKYQLLPMPVTIANVLYKYKYTDYFTLYIDNWHLRSYPLINVNEKNQFFISAEDAYEYMLQMRS